MPRRGRRALFWKKGVGAQTRMTGSRSHIIGYSPHRILQLPSCSPRFKHFSSTTPRSLRQTITSHHITQHKRPSHSHTWCCISPISCIISSHLSAWSARPHRIVAIIQHHPDLVSVILASLVAVRTAFHRRSEVFDPTAPGVRGLESVDSHGVEAHSWSAG